MKYLGLLLIISSFLYSIDTSAQYIGPGCYCEKGALATYEATTPVPTIFSSRRYSPQPCITAFGQADGTNCAACVCSDDDNDAGRFNALNKDLFSRNTDDSYSMVACPDILEPDEQLLFCGPCPASQLGVLCADFIAPDPGPMTPDVSATVPTMGQWGLISLGLLMLIISIVAITSRQRLAVLK